MLLAMSMSDPFSSSSLRCHNCGGDDIIVDRAAGDRICYDCGEVVAGRIMDERDEVVNYNDDNSIRNKTSRTSGLPETVGSLQTIFVHTRKGHEEQLSALKKAQFLSTDRNELFYMGNLSLLNEYCAKMNLVSVIKTKAMALFSQVIIEQRLRLNKQVECMAAACVYIASRLEGYPRTLDEVALHTGVPQAELVKMYKLFVSKLNLELRLIHPEQLVPRFANSVLIGRSFAEEMTRHECVTSATALCRNITNNSLLYNHAPQTVAACTVAISVTLHGINRASSTSGSTSASTSSSSSSFSSSSSASYSSSSNTSKVAAAAATSLEAITTTALVDTASVKVVYRKLLPYLAAVLPPSLRVARDEAVRHLSSTFVFPPTLEELMTHKAFTTHLTISPESDSWCNSSSSSSSSSGINNNNDNNNSSDNNKKVTIEASRKRACADKAVEDGASKEETLFERNAGTHAAEHFDPSIGDNNDQLGQGEISDKEIATDAADHDSTEDAKDLLNLLDQVVNSSKASNKNKGLKKRRLSAPGTLR